MNGAFAQQVLDTAWSSAVAITPLLAFFLIFQLFLTNIPRGQITDIVKGTVIAAVGLFLFLLGIGIAFLPFGKAIGAALAAQDTWLLLLVGVVLGFLTTWGEPSVRILADQVEGATNGSIPAMMVIVAICLGVAFWVGVGMLRLRYDLPFTAVIVPGYLLALGLLWFSDKRFLAIAVDAGGVATGPLANTFLLALALGAASGIEGADLISKGFGLLALISLAPIISVMILGFLVNREVRRKDL